MPPYTACSILGGTLFLPSITGASGKVRLGFGQRQWPDVDEQISKSTEKLSCQYRLYISNGGEAGIRTLDRLQTYAGFQDRCIQPLCHLSVLRASLPELASGNKMSRAIFRYSLLKSTIFMTTGAIISLCFPLKSWNFTLIY